MTKDQPNQQILDLSSFKKAIQTLEEGINVFKNVQENIFLIRDACIQRFEYTYEISYKMLRRYLGLTEQSLINELSFMSIIRLAYERGLVQLELDRWKEFRNSRNLTSHTYNQEKAKDVFDVIPDFLKEVKFLCNEIEKRQKRDQ